jgi:hypothetical protein
MADIRTRVDEDRGILKTIQTFVPGFRGYRLREDLRDSDRMLRGQLAKLLGLQRRKLESCRKMLGPAYGNARLEETGAIINQFKKVEGKVSAAEVGYSGISADLRIKEPEINKLYEYDNSMITNISDISQSVESLTASIKAKDGDQTDADLTNIRGLITDLEDKFDRRMEIITNTGV